MKEGPVEENEWKRIRQSVDVVMLSGPVTALFVCAYAEGTAVREQVGGHPSIHPLEQWSSK